MYVKWITAAVGCRLDSILGRGLINNMATGGGFGRVLVSHITPLSWEEQPSDHVYSELFQCPKTGCNQSKWRF